MVIGLDWDDTVTEYSTGLSKLVELASVVHIITLNLAITEDMAKEVLKFDSTLFVHAMADEEFDTAEADFGIGIWKANKCVELGVDLMIDDMKEVVDRCLELGISAIQVQAR
jgi:hypothetical protein